MLIEIGFVDFLDEFIGIHFPKKVRSLVYRIKNKKERGVRRGW